VAPSALTATAAGESQVNLAWSDNSLDETGFKLQRMPAGGTWTGLWAPANATSYTDDGLAAGTWCYRIRSFNDNGNSAYILSAPNCVTIGGGGGDGGGDAPVAPSNLEADIFGNNIKLEWDDNSSDETGFKIQRMPAGGTWEGLWAPANATKYTDAGPGAGTWCYRIRSFNDSGNSAYVLSSPNCVTIGGGGGAPAAPTDFTATPTSGAVNLTWTDVANNEKGYKLQWQLSGGNWETIWVRKKNRTSFTHANLAGGSYCYRIRTYNASGSSTYVLSTPSCVVVATPSTSSTIVAPEGFMLSEAVFDVNPGDLNLLKPSARPPGDATAPVDDGREVIRVYKNTVAWWDEDRDAASLAAIGKIPGFDSFVHPMSDLWFGVPDDTDVVFLASSAGAEPDQIDQQSSPLAQASLDAFVRRGGTLIVGLADNLPDVGYAVPGASGTPSYLMPSSCGGLFLEDGAFGADGAAATDDDHPLLLGPDGVVGTRDDLNDSNVGLFEGCYATHGNLMDGFDLPEHAQALIAADFGGVAAPVLAEYGHGAGRVIVTTITLEFEGQYPAGGGPTRLLVNLFDYALTGGSRSAPREELPDEPAEEFRPREVALDNGGIGAKGGRQDD